MASARSGEGARGQRHSASRFACSARWGSMYSSRPCDQGHDRFGLLSPQGAPEIMPSTWLPTSRTVRSARPIESRDEDAVSGRPAFSTSTASSPKNAGRRRAMMRPTVCVLPWRARASELGRQGGDGVGDPRWSF